MTSPKLEEIFRTQLSSPTADLIKGYAEVDESGYIVKFQTINEEVIAALKEASVRLADELLYGEQLSEHWQRKSPCEGCEQAADCSFTCRHKHNFDKEVYGGLLTGSLPCSYLAYEGVDGEKIKVAFKVTLSPSDELIFARPVEMAPEGVRFVGNKVVVIDGKGVVLRPWSMALYRFFVHHPEGVPISAIYTDHRREFVKIYESVVRSEVKSARLKQLLKDGDNIQRTMNNKLSELNLELRGQGVAPKYEVSSEGARTNHRPYRIEHIALQSTANE